MHDNINVGSGGMFGSKSVVEPVSRPIFTEQLERMANSLASMNDNNDRLLNFRRRLMQQRPEEAPDVNEKEPPPNDNVEAIFSDCLRRFNYALNDYGRLLSDLERGV